LLDDELRNHEANRFRLLNKVDAERPLVAAAGLREVRERRWMSSWSFAAQPSFAYTSSSESLRRVTTAALKLSASRDGTMPRAPRLGS
jgi:hypothetical protein